METGDGEQLRTNPKRITRYITDKITGWGFDVYLTISHTSRSRYLEFCVGKWRGFTIRISDHRSGRKYDYDVYTDKPRPGAINYMNLINILERRIFWGKTRKSG